MYIRRADERGKADFGWLQSAHSFSFGHYYDANHMGVSALRVINDDTVAPGAGFATHGHRDMEIISYVTEGALKHKDSEGNEHIIPEGDIQVMSAGSGITHSEYNASTKSRVKFLQIWVLPSERGGKPGYAQTRIQQDDTVTALITPEPSQNTLSIKQDMSLFRVVLQPADDAVELSTRGKTGYLHIVKGLANLTHSDDSIEVTMGDGIGLSGDEIITLSSTGHLEALWFELPASV
ncbi:pirin family protein [Alteromonas sediminis]|uniref:Pirin family protein n=1 Tax=Alteromonas sediminis TaxID=2259342 RepID=A0A3N5Y1C5_9ALTE|nr:pirin-like bicupin family protein [Alteromonas sediminis]RPJ67422.1 pirin family protein [Alteromonas sediminis]